MILRRIAEAFRRQDWFTVFVETMIVVLGVFLGLQVSNWNAARADRGVVAAHLSEIAEDLQSHLDFHGKLYGSALARIAAVDYIYDKAFDRRFSKRLKLSVEDWPVPETPEIDEEDLDRIMGSINLVRITVGSRKGYESLISSGHLGLMKDRELARAIQLYYGQYDDLLDTNQVFRNFRNDGVLANYKYGVSVFDERPVEEIVEIARDNPEFAAYLRTMRDWAIVHANFLSRLEKDTVTLLEKINADLDR